MRMKSIRCLLMLLMLPVLVQAQQNNDGSLYSRFGLGERTTFYSSQAQAMGGAGTAMFTPNYLTFANPATWSDQFFSRFAGGVEYLNLTTTDAADNTSELNNGAIAAIQFGVPLMRRKLGVAFGFTPYTRVGYRVVREGTLPEAGNEPGGTYTINLEGDGGLQEIKIGAGYKVHPNVSLGLNANLLFGILKYGQRTEFEEETVFVPSVEQREEVRLSGATATAGVAFRLPKLLAQNDALSFGAAVTFPVTLNATVTRQILQNTLTDTLGVPVEGKVKLPLRANLGFSYAPDTRWLVAADFSYEPWSNFDSDVAFGGVASTSTLQNRWRFGGGAQFIPAGNAFSLKYFRRVGYRIGGFVEQSYINPAALTNITTYAATAGLSLPSLFPGTYVDLNGALGVRGKAEGNLVRDLYYKIALTINFGERWFVKRKLR